MTGKLKVSESREIRNLGILAHVDAGKTTLTENMLYLSGRIKAAGNVNKGTSVSDGMAVEKRRGISVRASTLTFEWKGVQVNLIDTPGHVDFSAEVERSLRVLDCAVLVLSAVEGIQAQTEPIWDALEALDIPVILFINKIDRAGADSASVLERLREEFSPKVVPLNSAVNEGESSARTSGLDLAADDDLIEIVAESQDLLLEKYLNGENLSSDEIEQAISRSTRTRALFPVLLGVAKNNIGTEYLLDRIVDCFPDGRGDPDADVSGVVFRIDHDERLGRVAGVRLYAGSLRARDSVTNTSLGKQEKITQVKRRVLERYEDIQVLTAGDIGHLCGMPEVRIGDVLGDPGPVPQGYTLSEPLLTVQVIPDDGSELTKLSNALQMLSSEDPHLDFRWFAEEKELNVRITGVVQTEILSEILQQRFGLGATFGDPTVIFKETPAGSGFGIERYTMPKPCWAVVKYLIEPGERGSGISYSSKVSTTSVVLKYQNEIEVAIPGALKQGIKGWEVTDLKITFVEGEDHVLHSRPGNWKLATNIAILKGLTETDTKLLEPILAFRILASEEHMGRITSDILSMRGMFEPPEMRAGTVVLTGQIPLATSMDYPVRLSSLTGGKAKMSLRFDAYEECPKGEGVTREYKGICPLDRSKYILMMRGGITES
jgi:ribosomal protection tetracycline resistance protein